MLGGANDPNFIFPHSIQLYGNYEVLKQDGTPLQVETDGHVSGCNLFPMAIWENVSIFLNDRQISDSGRDYHHKAFMCHNYSYSDAAKVKMLEGKPYLLV